MVSTIAAPNPISRRVALTLAVCTLALNFPGASLAAYQEFEPPAAVDEWTEAGDFEDPLGATDHDWEEEEDKIIKREMADKSNSEDEGEDVDTFMELSTEKPRCGGGCTDPKIYGNQAWGGKKGKCIMPGGKVGNLCKTCSPCKSKGGPKPTPAPAAPAARRRRRSSRRRRRRSAPTTPAAAPTSAPPGKKLVWSDEFDDKSCINGRPGKDWGYEEGFVRNDEHQWYQKENARCVNGNLVITSGKHAPRTKKNPNFKRGSKDWKTNREHIIYTSSAIQTKGKQDFGLGIFEMRAKVDVREGAWPAWWTLGSNIDDPKWSWPRCGEIDMMEVFGKSTWERGPVNKGNMIYGTAGWWDYKNHRYVQGKDERSSKKMGVDSKWGAQWHIFKMDRKATSITLYVDGKVLNHFPLTNKNARDSFGADKKIFMLVNLALGGCCGGNPDTNKDHNKAPFKFEVDYIRVYN